MAKRVAFFAGKESVENFFNIESNRDNIFQPHYNLSPGQHIPIVFRKDGELTIERVRWGGEAAQDTTVRAKEAVDDLSSTGMIKCVVPLSGFYVWKDDKEKGSPFFVRMLNEPLMAVAGLFDEKNGFFKMVTQPSNVLINPMSETMPLLLDQNLSGKWLDDKSESDVSELIDEAKSLFLLTDLSVLRVSEKVNDPSNNNEKLVQPIPK